MIVQHGLNTLRGGEKHGLQPAMLIHWAQSLSQMVHTFLAIFIYSTVIPRPCQSLKREFQSNYQLFKAFCPHKAVETTVNMEASVSSLLDVLLILCPITQGDEANSYYDQKEYIGRSVHYWELVHPLLERIKKRRGIPEPLDPLFIHFPSKDIQVITLTG